jgi:sulfite dehydrogenase (cytochrome) subunit B
MKTIIMLTIGASLVSAAMALAVDQGIVKEDTKRTITLPAPVTPMKNGAGMDITSRYCGICHSLDYITTQQKFSKAKWQSEVTKMIKVYGAPISEENAKVIVDYITTHYGIGG